MTYKELQTKAQYFKGAVILDRVLSRKIRVRIKESLLIIIPLFITVGLYFGEIVNTSLLFAFTSAALCAWTIFFIADSYFDFFYLQDVPTVFHELGRFRPRDISYEIAAIALSPNGITEAFLTSPIGKQLLKRLAIDEKQTTTFIEVSQKADFENASFPETLTFSTFVETCLGYDNNLQKFFLSNGATKADVIAASQWVERETLEKKKNMRWWGRDALSKIKGVGKDWGYGIAYELMRHGHFADPYMGAELHTKEVELVEAALSRNSNANVLLLASDIKDAETIVGGLADRILAGTVLTSIEHKRIFILDEKAFESGLQKALDDAEESEEMIIVVQNILTAAKSATAVNVDLAEILRPYLESHRIQFILCGYKENAQDIEHQFLGVMNHVEKIYVEDETGEVLFRALEQYVARIERRTSLIFTFGAIKAIVKALESYTNESSQYSAMTDIVEDLAIDAAKKGERNILASAVYPIVTKKTGIRQGAVSKGEKETLLNLEDKLAQRVVGQSAALEAVASALRRSRAGITDSRRPMGSFLFLGPTGVGKTETAKALSDIYFGANVNVTRLDMSEYATESSLEELLGTLPGRSSSTLTSILREHMTGVLLLDEFEKAHPKVHNLFLQILGEGFFTDGRGKKVSLRNCIIIATSNAASEKIFDLVHEGKEPNLEKDMIIDSIIHNHTFSPELINRFDSVVIFHPLGREEMREVAKLMLERLKNSLRDRGFDLEITDKLVSYISTIGKSNEFGARALRRIVQDKLEEHIAKKIIAYDIQPGATITVDPEELSHTRM